MTTYLTLTPRDPLIARDGRPFGEGLRMRALDWLLPSVVAGSLRTLLGNLSGGFQRSDYQEFVERLKKVEVAGPFPSVDGQMYFPAPKDIVVRKEGNRSSLEAVAVRPARLPGGAGCDLPAESLLPVMLPDSVKEGFKPEPIPLFWSCERMVQWLTSPTGDGCDDFFVEDRDGRTHWADGILKAPLKDVRMHVRIEPKTGASEEAMLFQTTGLELERLVKGSQTLDPPSEKWQEKTSEVHLVVRVNLKESGQFNDALSKLPWLQPVGGERRPVHWSEGKADGWDRPENIQGALDDAKGLVRMVLATPAIFKDGWKPGWLGSRQDGLVGAPPGLEDKVKLKLIGACGERWQPVSGWSYEHGGPKAIRRVVPAGSAYFFEVCEGNASDLSTLWLHSVSDTGDEQQEQDRRDGFGLALWGIWEDFSKA